MKEHGAYSSFEAMTYDADREVEPLWHVENAFVHALMASHSGIASVLDVPVGTGRFLDLYGDKTVTGIDLSNAMLEEAGKRVVNLGLSQVTLQQGSVTDLPFADSAIDLVVSWRLFHLLPPDVMATALAELARVCRRTLCIQTYERAPLPLRFAAKAKRWARRMALVFSSKRRLTPWSHIRTYTHSREDIERAALAAGIGNPTNRTHLGDYDGTRVMALIWILDR